MGNSASGTTGEASTGRCWTKVAAAHRKAVGFGDSFLRPLCFEAEVEQADANGRTYRLLREKEVSGEMTTSASCIMQQGSGEQWEAQYRFTLQPRQLADFTERCRYHQTSPESHFTQQRICSLAIPTGRLTLSDLRLIMTVYGERQERLLASEEEYRKVLEELFGVVM